MADSKNLSIFLNHGGSFVMLDNAMEYFGGDVHIRHGIDLDRFGYLDLVDEIEKLGYTEVGNLYYKIRAEMGLIQRKQKSVVSHATEAENPPPAPQSGRKKPRRNPVRMTQTEPTLQSANDHGIENFLILWKRCPDLTCNIIHISCHVGLSCRTGWHQSASELINAWSCKKLKGNSTSQAIPDDMKIQVKAKMIEVEGPRSKLTRNFKHLITEETTGKKKLKVDAWFSNQKTTTAIRTALSHITNLINGVTKGYRYKMHFYYARAEYVIGYWITVAYGSKNVISDEKGGYV
ncbi:60S ribosomal protein l9 [Striga asiatica]|uniref:60S ribosomal protein l9 n=1 Tax=Striga asiatica TaxID=4170 RepID=A0A5A7RFD5_STRAF|nr:60S ribosomal protein l9 [Striga asiatica]